MVQELFNKHPVVYERKERCVRYPVVCADIDEYTVDPIDQLEVFDHIKDIRDPEHPYSLEELKVVTEDDVEVNDNHVRVKFTPTKFNCPVVGFIGLSIRIKLMRCLPSRCKVKIMVAPGTHSSEASANRQLNDKERVAAALENPGLVQMVDQCLAPTYQ